MMGRVPTKPGASSASETTGNQEDTLTGRSACIPCHTQLALPVSLKPWCVQLWLCPYYLCLHLVSDPSGLRGGWFYLLVQKYKKSHKFRFCRRHKMPAYAQRKLMSSCCLSEKGHHIAVPSPDISHKGLRSKRTQPADPKAVEDLPRPSSQRHEGPEFSFDLLSEARAIQVTIPPGPEVSVRLCHQWVLECEELSSPFDTQKIVSGGHAVDLPYEFLLPCLCIEASYLQEDTVRRKKCPFQNWPEAYGSDFWKSVHFTDYSQHSQMVMALTLRCPLKLQASLCQRQNWHTFCEDLPNATAQEAEGWYVLEGVDLHPQLCFKFSFRNSSHVECPHRTAPSWNVSMDTQAQQLVLHFSSRIHATFSAAWSHPSLGQDGFVPPVYSISQTQGSSPVTLDLIIPFLKPGSCVLVWRSDVQFSWKHLLCPDVSHRHLGLLILAILALATLLGIVLALTRRRPLSGPGGARPVLLLHAADSEAQRLLVGALAELLRAALGGGRDVIVDLWEGTRVARVGPLPWLWAARARVAQEQGTVLLLWSSAGPSPARGPDPRSAPLRALLCAAPRPLLLLAYFSRLCAKGDIPQPLRALPRYRLLRDLPRLLRALDAQPSTEATGRGRLGDRQCLRGRLELCHRLEREAAKLCPPRLSRDRRRGTGWNP
ncbi:interleukin-17 receptor E isoform X6 [Canis lupus familiaris]|uniref:interleukin-17 receptor E isoform X6 n=1 Tax=Canis lupus familiaris TaxID=9615 RepID=UPI0018F7E114|nr:interleukin-17 receptor E isoform X6 [Canis lupus familiaris]XP_038282906.1 interleukin-17 receptor E isoform X6 [Canis lupus familiaris]